MSKPTLEWFDHPTMNPRNTRQLRPLIERWEIEHLWGQPRRIMPQLVAKIFGDGRRLLKLYPIMFRPNHFVVRIDSATDPSSDYELWLDPIYEAIEGEFCEWPWAASYGLKWHEEEGADNDSRLDFGDGCSWSEMKWPRLKRRKA